MQQILIRSNQADGRFFLQGLGKQSLQWGTATSAQTSGRAGCDQVVTGIFEWHQWSVRESESPVVLAARSFAQRVASIPEVCAVVLDLGDSEPRITTYIERRDIAVRSRVHNLEFEVLGEYPSLAIDFLVLSLDSPGACVPAEGCSGIRIILRR
jgi:hypothetical protein